MEGALIPGLALLIGGLVVAGLYFKQPGAGDEDESQLWKVSNGFESFLYIGGGLAASLIGGLILLNQIG